MRQAEELCACVGCRATPGFAGLTREFGWPTTGPSRLIGQTGFQGDNYYRPVTFSAPSLGNYPAKLPEPAVYPGRTRGSSEEQGFR